MDHQPITSLKSVRLAVAAPDFQAGLSFFVEELGFEVAMIAPAEDPTYAVLTLEGMTIALDKNRISEPVTLEIPSEGKEIIGTSKQGPNGTKVHYVSYVREVSKNTKQIPVLNVDASAGFGAIAESETAHTRFGFDERWLARLTRAKSASLSIIHVLGDSMEPTLSDGDEVLVDASDQGSRLRDGIYVLRADDALVVKRVTLKPGGRKITISSDNSAYPSWDDVDRSEIQVVGRVIWFGRAV